MNGALYIKLAPHTEMKVQLTACEFRAMGMDSTVEEREPTVSEMVTAFRRLKDSDLSAMVESNLTGFRSETESRRQATDQNGPSRGFARVLEDGSKDSPVTGPIWEGAPGEGNLES